MAGETRGTSGGRPNLSDDGGGVFRDGKMGETRWMGVKETGKKNVAWVRVNLAVGRLESDRGVAVPLMTSIKELHFGKKHGSNCVWGKVPGKKNSV